MAISSKSASGPNPVPEDPQNQYIVTVNLTVTAASELAAADRVADLGRCLTENCEIGGWSFQSLETVEHARESWAARALLTEFPKPKGGAE